MAMNYLSGDCKHAPRCIIDFGNRRWMRRCVTKHAFAHLKKQVLPMWQANAEDERKKTGKEKGEHQNRLQTWWQLKRPREQML